MSESISPVWFCCAGNCFQDVEVSVGALLMRIVGLNLSMCIFQFLVKMIAQNNTFRPEPDANRAGKERREKSEARRHVELCVDPCKLSGWRDTHVSHVSLCFFFFRLAISFSFPLVTVTHLFSLSTSPLDSSFPPLPLFLFPWSICLPQSPRLPLFPLPALGSVASNAFHSAWLSRHMYPLYIIARTHSLTSVPADLISPSLSSLSPTTPHPNEKTWDLLKKKKKGAEMDRRRIGAKGKVAAEIKEMEWVDWKQEDKWGS